MCLDSSLFGFHAPRHITEAYINRFCNWHDSLMLKNYVRTYSGYFLLPSRICELKNDFCGSMRMCFSFFGFKINQESFLKGNQQGELMRHRFVLPRENMIGPYTFLLRRDAEFFFIRTWFVISFDRLLDRVTCGSFISRKEACFWENMHDRTLGIFFSF